MSEKASLAISPDQKLVERLARRHHTALLRYFRRKGFSTQDSEDAIQDVFVRLVRRDGLSNDVENFDAYLFRTAANVAIDLGRLLRTRRLGAHERYDETAHGEADYSPHDVLEGREALGKLLTALEELPERSRHVFVLARLERMRQPEIARQLGVSLSTIEKDLAAAMAYLAQKVEITR